MTWNILSGGEQRFEDIKRVIATVSPDILTIQECLGWEQNQRLSEIAMVLGVPANPRHVFLGLSRPRNSGRRYHVALLSRIPLERVRLHADAHFVGHCIVEARVGNVTVFATHFDSHHESLRFVEARYLRSLIDPEQFARDDMLLMGDLNSLSSRDPYPRHLAEDLVKAGTNKYGHPPRFEVIAELESFGWIDTLLYHGASDHWTTARRDSGGVRIDYRTDYVFASPSMANRLAHAAVLAVGGASDHDAVTAEFR